MSFIIVSISMIRCTSIILGVFKLNYIYMNTYVVELEIEATRVANWIAAVVSAP